MSEQRDGGPAYPQPCTSEGHAANTPWGIAGGGLSRRDWFAAVAPHDELGLPDTQGESAEMLGMDFKAYMADHDRLWRAVVAKARYDWADAMLAASDKEKGGGSDG